MFFLFLCLLSLGLAQHLWHNVHVTRGEVYCEVQNMFEQRSSFLNIHSEKITSFHTMNGNFKFALALQTDSTFNMIYSITCKEYGNVNLSPRCAFIISTTGPSLINVTVLPFQNIYGKWELNGNTVDLYLDFYDLE
jgi:hypothetical protein